MIPRPRAATASHAAGRLQTMLCCRDLSLVLNMLNMLGVRLDPRLDRDLATLARRRKTTKSAIAREAIAAYVSRDALCARAREQSLRAAQAADVEFEHDDREWMS